jgi:WD40 repeat protein
LSEFDVSPKECRSYKKKRFETNASLFDCAWSEQHENHIVTAGGDGSVVLWDVALEVDIASLVTEE